MKENRGPIIARLEICKTLEAKNVITVNDSRFVVSHIKDEMKANEKQTVKYFAKIQQSLKNFP